MVLRMQGRSGHLDARRLSAWAPTLYVGPNQMGGCMLQPCSGLPLLVLLLCSHLGFMQLLNAVHSPEQASQPDGYG